MTLVELVFHRNLLNIDAGQVQKIIEKAIRQEKLDFVITIKSVTVMSRWLVAYIDISEIPKIPLPNAERMFFELCCDTVAGIIVSELQDYAVRYRHFAVSSEGESLLFKEKTYQ